MVSLIWHWQATSEPLWFTQTLPLNFCMLGEDELHFPSLVALNSVLYVQIEHFICVCVYIFELHIH